MGAARGGRDARDGAGDPHRPRGAAAYRERTHSGCGERRGAAMSGSARVRLENVVKRHGSFTALHGIDLAIEPGEFFALLGPSGSGKTTTLRILAGLEDVNDGRVLLDDVDVTHSEPGSRDVAMVFQSYALYPHMTVAENIGFQLKMLGTPPAQAAQQVKDAAA